MSLPILHRRAVSATEPARYRALRRRSIRTNLTVAVLLVAAVSVASGIRVALRPSEAASFLVILDGLQAALSIGILIALRTSLRRRPAALAFGFLLAVPIVPMASLQVDPETVILVVSSLTIVPIAIALFMAWSNAMYVAWASAYATVIVAAAFVGPNGVSVLDRSETVAAVAIGIAVGVIGQSRRARLDRLAFDRERILSTLVHRSAAPEAARARIARAAKLEIEAILRDGSALPVFQPIVDLRTGSVAGYEALTRFADGTRPDIVFGLAASVGLAIELELATMAKALEAAALLPTDSFIGLNASPALLDSPAFADLIRGAGRPIVVEITEHVAIADYDHARQQIDALGPNVTLAVDDAGAGYASLRHILELSPRKVKIDIGLVRGIDRDPARQALIAGLGHFAAKLGIALVAEGIETGEELTTLQALGVGHGQGYLLGRPQPVDAGAASTSFVDLAALIPSVARRSLAADPSPSRGSGSPLGGRLRRATRRRPVRPTPSVRRPIHPAVLPPGARATS